MLTVERREKKDVFSGRVRRPCSSSTRYIVVMGWAAPVMIGRGTARRRRRCLLLVDVAVRRTPSIRHPPHPTCVFGDASLVAFVGGCTVCWYAHGAGRAAVSGVVDADNSAHPHPRDAAPDECDIVDRMRRRHAPAKEPKADEAADDTTIRRYDSSAVNRLWRRAAHDSRRAPTPAPSHVDGPRRK